MSSLYPGLRRAAEICTDLAREYRENLTANPHSPATVRQHAEMRAVRRIRARITDAMLAEPIESAVTGAGEGI